MEFNQRLGLIRNQLSSSDLKTIKMNEATQDIDKTSRILSKTNFVGSALDFLNFDEFLTAEESAYRLAFRKYMEDERFSEKLSQLVEKQQFGINLLRKLENKFKGIFTGLSHNDANNKHNMSVFLWAAILMELGRVDLNISSFYAIQSELSIKTLFLLGSEAQKSEYLQKLINLDFISSWCLTEPDYGSDASNLITSAEPLENGFIINGKKRWIGNGTFADIYFVWARNTKTNKIQCFLVEKNTKGLSSTKMQGKLALRAVQNAEISFDNVFVPSENALEKAQSFKDTNKILLVSRLGVCWISIGLAIGVYDKVIEYIISRSQFKKKIGEFQLVQNKISLMLGNIQAMMQFAKRITEFYKQGKMTIGKVSLVKAYCSKLLREVVSLGRETLGGNGILMDHKVMKLFTDAEAIFTYEGTYDVNMLVAASELTGFKVFK